MKSSIRFFNKKTTMATIVFVMFFIFFSTIFYAFSEKQTENKTFYCFSPFCGIISKTSGNNEFYYTDSYDSFNSDSFSFGDLFAYLDEEENEIIIKYQSNYSGNNYDAFYNEYCKKGGLFTDSLKLETISGKTLSASKTGTQPCYSVVDGSSIYDKLVFTGVFPYNGKDRCFF